MRCADARPAAASLQGNGISPGPLLLSPITLTMPNGPRIASDLISLCDDEPGVSDLISLVPFELLSEWQFAPSS